MVVLEGMLFGLAIAASSVGGPAEILDHERTGLLFPPRDATALAQALVRLIKVPALRHRLGQTAAREVRQNWLYSRVIERMRAVYAEMCTDAEEPRMTIGFPGIQADHFLTPRRALRHVEAAL